MTLVLAVLLVAISLSGAVRPVPSIDASLNFATPSGPQISPDGGHVVYQLSRTDWKTNSFESDLWMVDTASPHCVTPVATADGWNGDARWSPDGARIAYVSDRGGQREIYVVPVGGGAEARKITSVNSAVNLFRWAPDSKSIAFTTEDERQSHAQFKVVKAERPRVRLLRVSVEGSAAPEQILDGSAFTVHGFDWAPDGTRIAFQDEGIFTVEVATAKVTEVASGGGPYRNPMYSPDGKSIAFETAGGAAGFYYSNWFIATVGSGGGPVRAITQTFDEVADLYRWTTAGIFFGALQRTNAHLFVADPETRAVRRVTNPAETLNLQFSVTPDGEHAAFIRATSHDMAEVFSDGTQLTDYSAQLADYQFAQRELVEWTSADGTKIEGVLYKPADFDASKKYPLLVAIHGGPVAVDQPFLRADRNYPLEQFVARGALVLRPNYRGSAGYGATLRALAVRNLGTGDAADVISGVDALIARGFVDSERVGAMGWSEGGYVAAFLGLSTSRFKAVSVGAGISDWLTYYVNTDIAPFARQYLQSTPWQDPEMYRKASPISYINQAKTPVLIQHGDEDRRVPIANAYELRQALEDRNVPVRMIVYNGFGHSIDRPKQQRSAMEHNLEWFTEWILDPKAAMPVDVSRGLAAERASGDSVAQ
ncbi:MAG: S9 family peptidase [Acidobacteriota bacterium]|nr:S9 family peptidase [Acidobacteriota bacterium]